jgi:hypothetical protein
MTLNTVDVPLTRRNLPYMDDPIIIGSILSDELGGNDSKMWLKLFVEADKISNDFSARLMYMRNSGCCLQKNTKINYKIMPIKALWESEKLYNQEKKCLTPYIEELVSLLRGL